MKKADPEAAALIASLRRHGQLRDDTAAGADPHAPLPPGVTHVLERGKHGPRLVEKRKSFV